MGQPAGEVGLPRAHCGSEAAALHDIDVARRQRAATELVDAEAPGLAAHPHRLLQIGREVARRSVVYVAALRIDQPNPSRLQAEEAGDQFERALQRLLHARRAVQRLGHGTDDLQFTLR